MKKIFIFILFFLLLPQTGNSVACNRSHKIKIIKNELRCIELPTDNCGYIQFKNGCEKDVYYTNLECQEDKRFSHYQNDGFEIIGNEVALSRKVFSSPIIMDTENSTLNEYNRRINYRGGLWLPCKIKESSYNPENRLMSVQFRMDNKIYEITSQLPSDKNDQTNFSEFSGIVFIIKEISPTLCVGSGVMVR